MNRTDAPRISVFITSYNQRHYLVESIDSVLNQTLRPHEILIVDDDSTDGSKQLIGEYARKHNGLIRAIYQPRNLGIARNKAFAQFQVQGDWLTYLDGDDLFLPNKLYNEWNALHCNEEADIAYSNFFYIDDQGQRIKQWAPAERRMPNGEMFAEVFARKFPGKVVFRNELVARRCLDTVGSYDATLATHEDWDWKIKLAKQHRVVYCAEPGVEYRRHAGSITSTRGDAQLLRDVVKVYRRNRRLLVDLPMPQQRGVSRRVGALVRRKACRIVRLASERGHPLRALQYSIEFRKWLRFWFVLRMVLPLQWYRRFKKYFGNHPNCPIL